MRYSVQIVKEKIKVDVLVTYARYSGKPDRKLSLLKDRSHCVIHKDFKLSDEEMLKS